MSSTQRDSGNDVINKLIKFLPHEYVPDDKQVLILLSESHAHVCTLEKMTPRRYVHLGPEIVIKICDDKPECCHTKHSNINNITVLWGVTPCCSDDIY
jgi:hypothetical protein